MVQQKATSLREAAISAARDLADPLLSLGHHFSLSPSFTDQIDQYCRHGILLIPSYLLAIISLSVCRLLIKTDWFAVDIAGFSGSRRYKNSASRIANYLEGQEVTSSVQAITSLYIRCT